MINLLRNTVTAVLLLFFSYSLAQQSHADGYKGIWFTLGQFSQYGDKYSGGLGTYTSSHIPIAVYVKQVNKTFFVYGGTTAANERHLLIMLSYFDHKKQTVPKPVIVYDKAGVDDPHDNASLAIDTGGYIWVFVSGRNTTRPGIIFKSLQPYSIEGFEKIKEGEMTYPQPWLINNEFVYPVYKVHQRKRTVLDNQCQWKNLATGTKTSRHGWSLPGFECMEE